MGENNIAVAVESKILWQFMDKGEIKSSALPSQKTVSTLNMEISSVYEEPQMKELFKGNPDFNKQWVLAKMQSFFPELKR